MAETPGQLLSLVPPHLAHQLHGAGLPAQLPVLQGVTGALLLADLGGLASVAAQLEPLGAPGAQELARVATPALRAVVEAVERWGGSIARLGAASLLALFTGSCPTRRAEAAGWDIGSILRDRRELRTSLGPVPLRFSQTVHVGRLRTVLLGDVGGAHSVLGGLAVARLLRLRDRTLAGDLHLSRSARQALGEEPPPTPARPGLPEVPEELLRPFVAPGVQELVEHPPPPGYRTATVVALESRGWDPDQLQLFFHILRAALQRHEGLLLGSAPTASGTRWLWVHGFPAGRPDDPERGARAALEVMRGSPEGLRVRGGLQTGLVTSLVVGSSRRRALDLVGSAAGTAIRVCRRAAWGQVLMPRSLGLELPGAVTERCGEHRLKGQTQALPLHALLDLPEEEEGGKTPSRSPLVGRKAELTRLVRLLIRTVRGEGFICGLRGEPGFGKSRLRQELVELARSQGFRVLEGWAGDGDGGAYEAIATVVRQAMGLSPLSPALGILARVERFVQEHELATTHMHHLAEILGARYPDSPLVHLSARSLRLNNSLAVRALLQALCREQAVLVTLEDMHHADEPTRELLKDLSREIAELQLLVMPVYRSGYVLPVKALELNLEQQPPEEMAEILHNLLGRNREEVTLAMIGLLGQRAEGNLIFVEELARHHLERSHLGGAGGDTPPLRLSDIPSSLEALLVMRLAQLSPPERQVMEYGAVMGQSFSRTLLERFGGIIPQLESTISSLVHRDFLQEVPGEQDLLRFRHTFMRGVTYLQIPGARRRSLHRAVALTMEARPGEDRARELETLGRHWLEAGEAPRARVCFLDGARAAAASFDNERAERLYRQYLQLVEEPGRESAEAQLELAHQVLQVLGSHAEAIDVAEQAYHDARQRGEHDLESQALIVLGDLCRLTGRMQEGRQALQGALDLALELEDGPGQARALRILALLAEEQGRHEEAYTLQQQSLTLHREVGDRPGAARNLARLAGYFLSEGQFEEARQHAEEALEIFGEHGDRPAQATALGILGQVHERAGRVRAARRCYQEALDIHRQVGNRQEEGMAMHHLADLLTSQGRQEESMPLYEGALGIFRDADDRLREGIIMGSMADLHEQEGRLQEAIDLGQRAAVSYLELGNYPRLAQVLERLGHRHRQLGNRADARSSLESALRQYRRTGDQEGVDRCTGALDGLL